MGRAVEMCSGLGVCRKTLDGTMCPSYMATREEKHSTRGRANALRLAMAGTLGESGLGDHDVHDVLDLCLECRACKAECPVGVDVARFKSEFLAGYWRRHGMPWRTRAIGHAHAMSKLGSRFAPLSNLVAQSGLGRWINEKLLQHRPPAHAALIRARDVRAALREAIASATSAIRNPRLSPGVVLFNDTFTNYNHPEVGVAAAEVLGGGGRRRPPRRARLLRPAADLAGAAGRSARSGAGRTRTRSSTRRRAASASCSSSRAASRRSAKTRRRCCAATRSAGRGSSPTRACCSRTTSSRSGRRDGFSCNLQPGPSTVLLHGHCHQKAMGLMPPARALLGRIPSCTVVDLDAGCCGMAGSFGYAREHYEVSRQIGERKLLPAARAMAPDGVLVAAGVSCRQQVAHFTGVRAQHPAELLASLLDVRERRAR